MQERKRWTQRSDATGRRTDWEANGREESKRGKKEDGNKEEERPAN